MRVTRFGEPIAEILPPSPQRSSSWIGAMSEETEIVGDIVGPISSWKDWKAAHR